MTWFEYDHVTVGVLFSYWMYADLIRTSEVVPVQAKNIHRSVITAPPFLDLGTRLR